MKEWVEDQYIYAVSWFKTFMILVGLISTIAFIRVNFFGEDVMMDIPNMPVIKGKK